MKIKADNQRYKMPSASSMMQLNKAKMPSSSFDKKKMHQESIVLASRHIKEVSHPHVIKGNKMKFQRKENCHRQMIMESL